jgi:hypothetical protein
MISGGAMRQIPLSQNKFAIVDDCDFDRVSQFKWFATPSSTGRWYAARSVGLPNGKTFNQHLHRFIMGLEHGDPHQVDHKDRNATLDNRRENLRVTLKQNQQNIGIPKHNKSGFKGVSWCKSTEQWRADIGVNRRSINLGRFTSPDVAAKVYDAACVELHGEFAVTNASMGLLQ